MRKSTSSRVTLKISSAEFAETPVANNSSSQHFSHLDDHLQARLFLYVSLIERSPNALMRSKFSYESCKTFDFLLYPDS